MTTHNEYYTEEEQCEELDDKGEGYNCSQLYDCCSCGGNQCGCRYCFDCNCCPNCSEE